VSGCGASDLSGDWQGIYNYPDGSPPVGFEAAIRETGGALVGTIREVDDFIDPDGLALEATIDGSREGRRVRFTKFYDAGHEGFDLVLYEGDVSDDGREIDGQWHIPGAWSGSFIMVRSRGETIVVAQQVSETIR
jgi:hypothetical protein